MATAASVNLILEPIESNAVWGAGWYNAGKAHYADGAIRYEGNIDVELSGNSQTWDFIEKWVSSERAYARSLDISPDGARVYQYRTSGAYGVNYDTFGAWNTSANFATQQGGFVTCSLGVVAFRRNEVDPAGGTNYTNYSYIKQKQGVIASSNALFSTTYPLNPSGHNVNPIPFWKTNAVLSRNDAGYQGPFDVSYPADTGLNTVDWSVDVSQNQVVLYTCNGQRLPTAFLQGPQTANARVTLYNPTGVFDPILGPDGTGTMTTPYLHADNTWFTVQIVVDELGNQVFLELPAAFVQADEYSIQGPDSVTNRVFTMNGLAGRNKPSSDIVMPPFIMSSSAGAFVAP